MLLPLPERWAALWVRLGCGGDPNPVFRDLVDRYGEPHRHYHTLAHIEHCLGELEPTRSLARQPDLLELALWFHDVVYEPLARDNEERSATLADTIMRAAGLPTESRVRMRGLILATKRHDPSVDPDAPLMVDIDLSILGQPAPAFDRYEQQIRLEYAQVADRDFARGRSAVLLSFLDRDSIYVTDPFRERYEAAARMNLRRSLAGWQRSD